MNRLLKILFFGLIVKPITFVVLGLNIRGKNNLPLNGPAILLANHNSHLDTMVLMSLYPLSKIHKVRPVAAADYFVENGGFLAWLSRYCIDIIPLDRSGEAERDTLFQGVHDALDQEDILILFPEGSRGAPEQMSDIKKGVYHIASAREDTQLHPIMMHGLGLALPRGEGLFVPFNCDVIIDEPLPKLDDANHFVSVVSSSFAKLNKYCITQSSERE